MTVYKTYKEVRNGFSPEAQARITAGANKIREQLKILRTLREVAGISQEELAERLDVKHPDISQLEEREEIALNTLVEVVVALGGSLDITINFPEKAPISFSRIETILSPPFTDKKNNLDRPTNL
ncbi:helix-turn-helix domain-containing protein [Limnofasciculus baicalensis]|uniref:Helix-turn-helix domain-containing protein n=1 Tax=Limnofasciculus baicalensis BBK-W-15 TaxID=2699891 RepID=A0AAE3GU78_9CYAN|nr:XRE family transcriptional regulator [Limnofasciculus baicalensis]MCP2730790.1 helix-turn-helix domain-containing protein [Limnofasciculus baicalensis BBK-W-15]